MRIVWITGGGTGLGREMAKTYSSRGDRVIVSGRRLEKLHETLEGLDGTGHLALPCDVTSDQAVQQAVSEIQKNYGKLDVAIANAGYSCSGNLEQLSIDDWKNQYEVNVFGVLRTAKYSLPMLKATRGRFAIVGSVASLVWLPGVGPYQSSKAAVLSIGKTLCSEWHDLGVSCTTLLPGFVESDVARTDNNGNFDPNKVDKRPQFLMWKADRAAKEMVKAIDKRKVTATITGHGKFIQGFVHSTPRIAHSVMKRMNDYSEGE